MAENYDLIFGQSASSQYAWSDSDYQNGWQTVGSTPPTAEQFDALQRKSDTKAKDLNDRLEPLETKAEADGRQASTAYTAGTMVTVDGLPNGWLLECVVPGKSGARAITLPPTLIDGLTIVDGKVTWKLRKVATTGGLGYRQPSTAYTARQIAYHATLPTGWYLECTTAGTTGSGALVITLPSVGGTVTDGTVVWTVRNVYTLYGGVINEKRYIISGVNDAQIVLAGGSTQDGAGLCGAKINLFGEEHAQKPGFFELLVKNSTANKWLVAHPDGTLQWAGNDLAGSAIVAKSLGQSGYIEYASGLVEQWGGVGSVGTAGTQITFPISFKSSNRYRILVSINRPSTDATARSVWSGNLTESGATIYTNTGTIGIVWYAIGHI